MRSHVVEQPRPCAQKHSYAPRSRTRTAGAAPVKSRNRKGAARSLRHGHQLEDMAVGVLEVDAAAAVPIVELAVVEAPGRAAVAQALRFDPAEDPVELAVIDVERIVMAVETALLVKQQSERVVEVYRREVAGRAFEAQPEDTREEARGGFLVVGRHNGVVQGDGHRTSPAVRMRRGHIPRYQRARAKSVQRSGNARPDT